MEFVRFRVLGIDLSPLVFWLIMLIIMIGVSIILQRFKAASDAENERELQNFLARWGARFETRADGSREIRLCVDNSSVTIEYTSREPAVNTTVHFTHLNISLPTPGATTLPRLEIRHQLLIDQRQHDLYPYPGNQDIQIGYPNFDDAFVILGKDPQRIGEFLTPEVQAAIVTLSRFESFGQEDDLHLETYDGWLRISKHYLVRTDAELSQLVSFSKALVDVIQQQTSGIQFLGTAAPVIAQDTQCRVCGDPLSNQVVFCAKCRSPHHQDCWQYIGRCSVYGCGHQQFVANRPRQAQTKKAT